MNLMLLCAGEGTRLQPHTRILPKPAIPFLTVPMAAYGIEWARELSPHRLIVNTFHLPEKIHALFHEINHGIGDVRFSDEQPLLMGPGGGVMKARTHLEGDDFVVMNGDEILLPRTPGRLAEAWENHKRTRALATLLVMDHPGVGTQFGGVWTDDAGNVLGFGKNPLPGSTRGRHYIGALILSNRIFDFLATDRPSNILYDALTVALARGERVRTSDVEGWWRETGNEKDYLEATHSALEVLTGKEGPEKRFLNQVLHRHSPGFVIENGVAPIFKAAGASADGSGISGFAVLGRGSSLAPVPGNENAVLGDGVQARNKVTGLILSGS